MHCIASCLMSFVDSLLNFCQSHFLGFIIKIHVLIHVSSYITVYDMYVLPFDVIKNRKAL